MNVKCDYPGPTSNMIEWKGLLYYKPKKITNHVWVGSEATAADPVFLKKNNIKLVVNCTADIPKYSNIPMLRVPVHDAAFDADKMAKYLGVSSMAIRDVTRYKGNVLVHCRAGQNRSASVTAAYIMTIKGITAREAMDIVRSRKCETFRPMNFLSALKAYEKKLVENGVIKPKKTKETFVVKKTVKNTKNVKNTKKTKKSKNLKS
ncbi:dual specificity protein phosphatase 16 / mitogen-activated protein kinase phosphatase 7 [Paramecium bursaria Chlorella virus KS1B]|nr:dual specificity protein phosphatase 16 / mitogen-activated protein kinase phosphatase 7 [Paramecium bursaria Chlorella virus CviKI]AGE52511.1 dual specificity protein phosphatase 16 / mitogen-activated protein kinase phosphatase 7 [Paramecium bursaria Chlorella virus CvsA1]AGE54566.1 dual specificity protein phosphatase 16 / mitogen-activated protein kinase phosphatase 7 [Paramecium bursaria Chlorella virus KS1B]AGE55278.1 dual specificity protein phosphatase 16 / mitogen-activated protein k